MCSVDKGVEAFLFLGASFTGLISLSELPSLGAREFFQIV